MKLFKSKQLMISYVMMLAWLVLLFWFSANPGPASTEQSGFFLHELQHHGFWWATMHGVRKSAHFLAYAALGGLAYNILRQYLLNLKNKTISSILFVIIYAGCDEIHQLFVPGRTGRLTDVLIDTGGALAGLALALLLHIRLISGRWQWPWKSSSIKALNKKSTRKIQRSKLFYHLLLLGLSFLTDLTFGACWLILGGGQLAGSKAVPLILICALLLAISLIVTWLNRRGRSRRAWLIFSAFVITLSIIYNAGIITVLYNARNFTNGIQVVNYTYVVYDILALKNNQPDIKKVTMVERASEPYGGLLDQALGRRGPASIGANTVSDMIVMLERHQVNIMALPDSMVATLKENAPDSYAKLHVIEQVRIKVVSQKGNKIIDTTKPFIVYISGLDTAGPIATVSRSDVNMLVVFNPDRHKILLVNTPRDYYVQLHGITGLKDKLTHSGIYGINESLTTMEDLYGVNIDNYVKINFTTLLNVINALGGITVQSEQNFCDGGYCFNQGPNFLNAKQALAFARARHPFADGDRQRGRDQQLVIEAIIARLNDPGSLLRYNQLLGALGSTVQTDASPAEINGFMRQQMNDLHPWETESISVTGSDDHQPTYSMGADLPLYVMEPDAASVQAAKDKISQYLVP